MDRNLIIVDSGVVAEKMRSRRKELKLTQAKLGNLSGFTQQEISDYEKSEHEPNLQSVARLAIALNVSIDWLLGLSEDKERH